jgi:kynurenine formamidase
MRPHPFLAAVLVALTAVLPAAAAGSARPALETKDLRIVDLTHPFNEKTIYWPTSPTGFELKRLSFGASPGGWFYAANAYCAPEHGGTHLDAPLHFSERGSPADRIPLEKLVAPAAVIDVSAKAEADRDYRLLVADVEAYEKVHGKIAPGTIVLMRSGWSTRWPNRKAYLGDDTPGDASHLHFPSFGVEAARLLVEERGAAALGVDTASIDNGPSQSFEVHRIAASRDVPGLENLDALDQLPPKGATLIALPLKIEGGSGGPARVIALVPAPH